MKRDLVDPRYRILTFNWHEAYVSMLAGTGHDFDVVQRNKAGLWFWLHTTRHVPDNVSLVHPRDAIRRLCHGSYDLVVCHTQADVDFVRESGSDVATILVFHNYRDTEVELSHAQGKTHWSELDGVLPRMLERVEPVFISPGKRDSWQVEGEVILPGIDGDVFNGYRGDMLRALRVGNFLIERDVMLGGVLQQEVLRGLPTTTLGLNRSIPDAGLSASFDALLEAYRSHRLYLHTSRAGREDSYNLALLEAMATGMPVVALDHPRSIVADGEQGLVGCDRAELRKNVMTLLHDESVATRLGAKARESVLTAFSAEKFRDLWNGVFRRVAVRRDAPRYQLDSPVRRRRVLLLYGAYPATTARYLERALRQDHVVVTAGPTITPEIWRQWKLENLRELPTPHDIEVDVSTPLADIWEKLPPGFDPDLVLWIETGLYPPPEDLASAPAPVAGYLIDTHFHIEQHLEWAPRFDHVFLAQKAYVDAFRARGHAVSWLPLACDPEVHRPGSMDVEFDVGFIGSLVEPRRVEMIEALMGHFRVYVDRLFLDDMAASFSRASITWNSAARGDLNMRVFEALASGCFLLTESVPEAGLTDLFEDGTHLALYEQSALVERTRYYLDRPEERQRIAARGRVEVLAHHTYRHRVFELFETIDARQADRGEWAGANAHDQTQETAP